MRTYSSNEWYFGTQPFRYLSTGMIILLFAFGTYAFTNFVDPTVSVAADKMNVLYVGVDNPLTIAMADVSTEELLVESEALELINQGNGHFIARAKEPGDAMIRVSSPGKGIRAVPFRVKKIPTPIALLENRSGGKITAAYFKETTGLSAKLKDFDFDAQCEITSYTLTRVGQRADPIESKNIGGPYTEKSQTLIEMAAPGDMYYFDEVICRCPGDEQGRTINSLVFKIQ